MHRNPYSRTTASQVRLLYARRTEPDMRLEFNATMDGLFPEIAKKQQGVIRSIRLDEICACVDKTTGEPDLDTFCPICHGEGFNWDEILIDTYKVVIRSSVGLSTKEDLIRPGLVNIPLVSFYIKSTVDIKKEDKIVELVLDTEGNPVKPFRRDFLYRIGTAIDFRSDNGKLEYWKLDCYTEQRKFLNGPDG